MYHTTVLATPILQISTEIENPTLFSEIAYTTISIIKNVQDVIMAC